MYLARSGAISGFEALVTELGGNPVSLIGAAGLTSSLFRDPNTYISYSKMAELLERCARATNEPLFGLMLAERHGLDVLGELPATISQETTIGAALRKFDQFLFLHATGAHVRLNSAGDNLEIQIELSVNSAFGVQQQIMMSVGDMATLLATLLMIDRFSLKLHLRQAAPILEIPPDLGFYPRIQFASSFDGIKLPASTLERKAKMDDDTLQSHFRAYQQSLRERYPDNLQSQIKETIGHLLSSGDYTLDKVASNLDMNPRVLQKRLQKEKTTYGKLLRETRQVIAEQHLAYGSTSITDLALQLGYAEVSIFSRQFKQWTGHTPRQWKQKNQ